MRISHRQSIIGVMILLIVVSVLLAIILAVQAHNTSETNSAILCASAALFCSGLLAAYWRGFHQARYLVVIFITLLATFGTPELYLTQRASITFFIPPVIALILVGPLWVLGSAAAELLILLALAGWQGIYTDPTTLLIYALSVGGITIARLVTDTAQHTAEASRNRVEEQNALLEEQAHALAAANTHLQVQVERQGQLLDLIAVLETPAVQVADGVLLAPVVGHMDARRIEILTHQLLTQASAQRIRLVILDIAGVAVMDSAVTRALLDTARALHLLGCAVSISGISASVAASLVQLGADLTDVRTVRSPQEALALHASGAMAAARRNGKPS